MFATFIVVVVATDVILHSV